MSFSFTSEPAIPFDHLMGGCLAIYGIRAVITEETTGLEGPDGFLHVFGKPGGTCSFKRYGAGGNIEAVIDAIRSFFSVELIGEDDPRYYGFATWEEYAAWLNSDESTKHQEEGDGEGPPF